MDKLSKQFKHYLTPHTNPGRDRTLTMQELASVSRARDYINHLESIVSRESDFVELLLLEENLKQLSEIEAKMKHDSATSTEEHTDA